ncbi:hypothetical protein CBS101457_001653 [Exobasidium rhododendri]|nr:hypothetical protein CBS101457_001653 [Exobasidium rhododendri]
MAPYNPMKKHMDKLDDWSSAASKKYSSTRDAAASGSGTSMTERLNLARGKDDRWERTRPVAATDEAHQTSVVPQRAGRLDNLPKGPSSSVGGKGPPPPPPSRGGTSISGAPAPLARSKAPGPPLPRRMDNEAGTDRPPPTYGSAVAPTSGTNHIEFSKFTEEDKQAFFLLLDEFFEARSGSLSSAGELHPRNSRKPLSADDTSFVQAKATKEPSKPSGPGAKASMFESSTANPAPSSIPSSSTASSSPSYPRLSASSLPTTELCTALTCATFLCYPDSFPDWSGPRAWYLQPNAIPLSIKGRSDVSYSTSSMYRGNDHSLLGGSLFADLSCLWWKVSWDQTDPARSVRCQVAYKQPPEAWNDEGRLAEASRGFGDWIAGFAETNERNRTPVGDGECWTLAADAITYTNEKAGLTEGNRLMKTIGRTHGFLLFAGKADEVKGQCGRWRGGDRFGSRGGGVRRGDIVEWKSAKCRLKGSPAGSYVILGSPEHTAIIVQDSPLPKRIEEQTDSGDRGEEDFYSILGVARTAGQPAIRAAYLQGARRHHPDKQGGVQDNFIQRLNEAHATLSDATLRADYDARVGRQGSSSNVDRLTAQVDLDSFDLVESADPDSMMFHYPCRCGSGFYIDEKHLQNGQDVVGCTGCSEKIRVLWQDGPINTALDDDRQEVVDEQPSLSPWELDSITVIEQSAGKAPSRATYDLGRDSFTKGDIWIYRPVWEAEYLGGPVTPSWPPSLPGWEQLA